MSINQELTHKEQLRIIIDRIVDERDELLRQRDLLLDAAKQIVKRYGGVMTTEIENLIAAIAECEKGASHD